MNQPSKHRKPTIRSKTGCLTCKTRKVKCGEERPGCLQCQKSGWNCDEYGNKKASAPQNSPASPIKIQDTGSAPFILPKLDPDLTNREEVPVLGKHNNGRKTPIGACKIKVKKWESESNTASRRLQALAHYGQATDAQYAATISARQTSPADYTIPFRIPGTSDELQVLHYFNVEAAAEVSGFPSMSFWNNTVMCRMIEEPAIMQAVLALSICHHKSVVDQTATAKWQETSSPTALRQYNKALRQLREYLSNNPHPSKEIVLICCIVFYSVEILRQEYGTAIRHLEGGLVLLRQWMARQMKSSIRPRESGEDVNNLIATFGRMDIGAGSIVSSAGEIRRAFSNLEQALVGFNMIRTRVIQFVAAKNKSKYTAQEMVPSVLSTAELDIQKLLDQWSSNIKSLISQLGLTTSTNNNLVSIRLQYQCLSILFQISKSSIGEDPRELGNTLSKVLQACELSEQRQMDYNFTFGVEVPTSLWLLAMTTQEATMKSRALQLIQNWPTVATVLEGQKLARLTLSIML